MEYKGVNSSDTFAPENTRREDSLGIKAEKTFALKVAEIVDKPLQAVNLETLQVNLGYKCNMSCRHCHINAGLQRREMMSKKNIDRVLHILDENPIKNLDLTGGAPELHPHFKYIVGMSRAFQKKVTVRSNLTIIFEPDMESLPSFYRDHKVDLIVSLPSFEKRGVERMRGPESFEKSIEALRIFNGHGFGIPGSGLLLHLVHNPNGAFLPPDQKSMEKRYKRVLNDRHGVEFNKLFTFANMPLGKFKGFLLRSDNYEKYMAKLRSAFNPATLDGIMCRHILNVGWDGTLYDCDFNQVSGCRITAGCSSHVRDFDYERLLARPISFKEYCFGCTAGQGST